MSALDPLRRDLKRLGVAYRDDGATVVVDLPDRELRLRARGGRGLFTVEAIVDGQLDAHVVMTRDKAVGMLYRVAG